MIKIILILVVILSVASGTLTPNSKKNKNPPKTKEVKVKSEPDSESVFERNLVDEEPVAKDILVENKAHHEDTETRHFNGTVLGYVTPWNNHGYDVAKTWGPKFDVISPVWLQILRTGPKSYEIGGEHDIDAGWVADVKKSAHQKTKVLPRILFDKFTDDDFSKLLTYKEERDVVSNLVLTTCKKHKFDGVVLEVWSALSARVDDDYLQTLVIEIAEKLRDSGYDLILVIPPVRKEMVDLFSKKHFEALYPYVTAFSLMTYDFSNVQRPGANAPLYWVRNAVKHICPEDTPHLEAKRSKILLGLNFYGNDYTPNGGASIVGHEYLSLLKHVKGRLQFDEKDVENFFEVRTSNGRHIVFYPTLHSINERILLAQKLGTGLSIWELGQGLDYFYDLF